MNNLKQRLERITDDGWFKTAVYGWYTVLAGLTLIACSPFLYWLQEKNLSVTTIAIGIFMLVIGGVVWIAGSLLGFNEVDACSEK